MDTDMLFAKPIMKFCAGMDTMLELES